MAKLNPPSAFDFKDPSNFGSWLSNFELYRIASKLKKEDGETQLATLLYCMGEDAKAVYDTFSFQQDADKTDFKKVTDKFKDYFRPKKNLIHARSIFHKRIQMPGETAEAYIRDLYKLADNAEFNDKEDHIRDRLVIGVIDQDLSRKLQIEPDLTLTTAVGMIKQAESVKNEICQQRTGQVDGVRFGQHANRRPTNARRYGGANNSRGARTPSSSYHSQKPTNPGKDPCRRCGGYHPPRSCPAYHATCNNCHKKGHYQKVCESGQYQRRNQSQGRNHHQSEVTAQVKDDETARQRTDANTFFMDTVVCQGDHKPWYVDLTINHNQVARFKVDSGADVTLMSRDTYDSLKYKPSLENVSVSISSVNAKINVFGSFLMHVIYKGSSYDIVTYVADCRSDLLSRGAASAMSLLSLRADGLGVMSGGPVVVAMRDVEPFSVSVPRKVPFALKPKIDTELDRMVNEGVISPVTGPTSWCSNIVPVEKPNGSVRICVDLREVNRAVKREHYPIPSFDDLASQFKDAAIFSLLDARSGYHQIPLAEESKKITTFITHRGRFCFNRLPFGITSASEIFQRRMEAILGDLPGVVIYQDDVVVFGSDQQEHETRLKRVKERITANGIELNVDKCKYSMKSIKFLGHIFGRNGIHIDPSKIKAIEALANPSDVHQLRRLLGSINYLQRFVPNLSALAKPLNDLLKDDSQWVWDEPQRDAVRKIVEQLTTAPHLKYFDPRADVTISADACLNGLGATLTQGDRYIMCASRTLTPAEKRYSNIERELLGLVWACERFDQYVRGLPRFKLVTDHKPLVPLINGNDLSSAPLRCQRMLMRLMRYNPVAEHVPGKSLTLPDALSRSPVEEPTGDLSAEVSIYVNSVVTNMPISDTRLEKIRRETADDPVIAKAITATIDGWPKSPCQIDDDLQQLFHARAHLSVADGLLLYDARIVIPTVMRTQTLELIHEGHMGIEKCRDRAVQTVWWPGISTQIAEHVSHCQHCNRHSRMQMKEPMMTEAPVQCWHRVATDLFQHRGINYLVLVDQYSRYIEISQLRETSSAAVIQKLEWIFSRWGFPLEIMSDNGPQYSSHEFQAFVEQREMRHITSSPRYPQSNGCAERAVATAKKILNAENPAMALLSYRSSKTVTGYSPNEIMLRRQVRTTIPCTDYALKNVDIDERRVRENENEYRSLMKHYYDRNASANPLPPLSRDSPVRLRRNGEWTEGTYSVVDRASTPRSYIIRDDQSGKQFRRNRRQLLAVPNTNAEQPVSSPQNTNTIVTRSGRTVNAPKCYGDWVTK